ncbi:MAG: hypothetical protein IIU19_03245, partial [Oscillospiraceae bacterium]|nr:hypothetical protein [Oscillospiraceae bacterium]
MTDRYESPLPTRYASQEMTSLFSQDTRYRTWRRLWAVLARTEKELGLPITDEQVSELFAHTDDIDYELVRQREKEVRHDVMAHVWAYGKAAPSAAGIIHLGATSCYVTDNADLIIYRDALALVREELRELLSCLSRFADRYKDLPVAGYTHYQPAQPVTAGKRAALWLQDLFDLHPAVFHAADETVAQARPRFVAVWFEGQFTCVLVNVQNTLHSLAIHELAEQLDGIHNKNKFTHNLVEFV